jgi:hypothetical protein
LTRGEGERIRGDIERNNLMDRLAQLLVVVAVGCLCPLADGP